MISRDLPAISPHLPRISPEPRSSLPVEHEVEQRPARMRMRGVALCAVCDGVRNTCAFVVMSDAPLTLCLSRGRACGRCPFYYVYIHVCVCVCDRTQIVTMDRETCDD